MAALSDQALCAGGYGVSLDAFDCVSARLVREVLDKVLPAHLQPWDNLLCTQWQSLRKFFHYGGKAMKPILGEMGIPQGDPASPVALILFLLAGKIRLNTSWETRLSFSASKWMIALWSLRAFRLVGCGTTLPRSYIQWKTLRRISLSRLRDVVWLRAPLSILGLNICELALENLPQSSGANFAIPLFQDSAMDGLGGSL